MMFSFTFWVGSIFVIKKFPNQLKFDLLDRSNENLDVTNYTGGDVLGCFLGVLFGVFSLSFSFTNIKQIADGTAAGYHAFKIIERTPSIIRNEPEKRVENLHISGDINFKNVEFGYNEAKKVLKGISLHFEHGKTTAIVGMSGSGKSTIAQLLERFYDPQSGSIEIGGKNLNEFNVN